MNKWYPALVVTFMVSCAERKESKEPCQETQAKVIAVECDKVNCGTKGQTLTTLGDDAALLTKVSFSSLPDWELDDHLAAAKAFKRSCDKEMSRGDSELMGAASYAGTIADWRPACSALSKVKVKKQAKEFFETMFHPYSTFGTGVKKGKFTGYYVQDLRVSKTKQGRYVFPLLKRPSDLIETQLDHFISDGRSRRIWGRTDETGRLQRYPVREELYRNLKESDVLAWTDEPTDAIGIQIEGSGIAHLQGSDEKIWIHFDGKNGRRGGRNGAVMRAMRKMKKENGGKPWTSKEIDTFYAISNTKVSEVFFKFEERKGAIGTQDVILTPQRSVAVDRAIVPMSTPVWIDTLAPPPQGGKHRPYRRLMIAQDTGGNILGTVRVDIYFGHDDVAYRIGGKVNHPGKVWLLLPKTIAVSPLAN